jgi:PrgI family protein
MAVYKVLQDIEGEDHLILWLTPRQSIYAVVVFISGTLAFFLYRINFLLAVPWLIPIGLFGFLAAPLGKDQPNDIWAAAQLRFMFKNRKRLWDQSGMQELVHVTVPKRAERVYTDGLNQREVRSRLSALSTTIDSRGWAIKNSNVNYGFSSQNDQFSNVNDQRLVSGSTMAVDVPISDVTAADDIMDQDNNQVAQRFDAEIKRQEQDHKDKLRRQIQAPAGVANTQQPQDYYFLNQPSAAAEDTTSPRLATFSAQVITPGAVHDNTAVPDGTDQTSRQLLEKIHHDKELAKDVVSHGHERVIRTSQEIAEDERLEALQIAEQNRLKAEAERTARANEELTKNMHTETMPNAILKELSQSELKISTIAVQAKHSMESVSPDGEVTISLH